MKKSLPGLARSLQDPILGDLDPLLDPLVVSASLSKTLLKKNGPRIAAVSAESMRWKPGIGVTASWLCVLGDGSVARAVSRTFPTPERARVALEKARTHRLVEVGPFQGCGRSSDERTVLLAFPNDRELPGMPRLLDLSRAKHSLGQCVDAWAVRGLRVRARASSLEVKRYKPERRCVIRYEVSLADDASGARLERTIFGRVLPRNLAATLAPVLRAIATPAGPLAQYLGWDPETSTLFQSLAPGVNLDEQLEDAQVHELAGAAMRRIHEISMPAGLGASNFAARLSEMSSEGQALANACCPTLARKLPRLVQMLQQHTPSIHESHVLVHGDFHPGQCVSDRGRMSIFDLDSVEADSRFRDVGHYLASLTARESVGMMQPAHAQSARAAFLEGAVCPSAPDFAHEEALSLLEHALSPIRRLEADCVRRADVLLECALEVASKARGTTVSRTPAGSIFHDADARLQAVRLMGGPDLQPLSAEIARVSPRENGRAEVELLVRSLTDRAPRSRHAIYENGRLRECTAEALLDGNLLTGLVARAQGCDPSEIVSLDTTVLALRPERRCAVRVSARLRDGRNRVQTVRWARSGSSIARAEWLRAVQSRGISPFPRILHTDEHSRCVVSEYVEGDSWSAALRAGKDTRAESVLQLMSQLYALTPTESWSERHFESELRTIERLRLRARALELGEPSGVDALFDKLTRDIPSLEFGTRGLVHGDLYDSQFVLGAGDRSCLLDWDTLSRGDRILDAGNLLAHLLLAETEMERGPVAPQVYSAILSEFSNRRPTLDWCIAQSLLRIALVHYPRNCGRMPGARLALRLLELANVYEQSACGGAPLTGVHSREVSGTSRTLSQ